MLCLWEAQFGDFANGAQVVIDQFIVSGESKWQRTCGIVLLLPHGYEGQGPEHSSARLERFLQSCAEENIQVANLTTPAQYFHILRRQMKRDFRKPLIDHVAEVAPAPPGGGLQVRRVRRAAASRRSSRSPTSPAGSRPGSSSAAARSTTTWSTTGRRTGITDTAIVRVEQLYPLHTQRLAEIAKQYAGAKLVWCQEESQNMGAWTWIAPEIGDVFGKIALYAGRGASSSPAVGSSPSTVWSSPRCCAMPSLSNLPLPSPCP